MEAGDYVLRIIVTDSLAKDKYRVATQAMEFELQKLSIRATACYCRNTRYSILRNPPVVAYDANPNGADSLISP
jgi:hypothetical protein